MTTELQELGREAMERLEAVKSSQELDSWRADYLGRHGAVTALLRALGSLPAAERPAAGRGANELKCRLQAAWKSRAEPSAPPLPSRDWTSRCRAGHRRQGGCILFTATIRRMQAAFAQMGFQVFLGPDVETDDYNFTLLNIPPYHPTRDSHDTFYTTRSDVVLRTHTSPAQVRVMRQTGAPAAGSGTGRLLPQRPARCLAQLDVLPDGRLCRWPEYPSE